MLRKIVFDIVDEGHALPECFKIEDIAWDPVTKDQPVAEGGFALIYNGRYNGETVALKELAYVPKSEMGVRFELAGSSKVTE